jgi:RNase P subunit RPR2
MPKRSPTKLGGWPKDDNTLIVRWDVVIWLDVAYSRVCPKCGGVIVPRVGWRCVTKLKPDDGDHVIGSCRKSRACGWHGKMPRVASDKTVAK